MSTVPLLKQRPHCLRRMSSSRIATLATKSALPDLQLLLGSLELWNSPPPTVHIACDTPTAAVIATLSYKGVLKTDICLDAYTQYTREQMEQLPGKTFSSLWFDFMCEKIWLLQRLLTTYQEGIYFCDADICWLGPLPTLPATATLGLSPHSIRPGDTDRFGFYNGGLFWVKDPSHLDVWLKACPNSPFFEQKAMEGMCPSCSPTPTIHHFPIQVNYGWWRLFQGVEDPAVLASRWTLNRQAQPPSSGISVEGSPLLCIHTHFLERSYRPTIEFNKFVQTKLTDLARFKHKPAKDMLTLLERQRKN